MSGDCNNEHHFLLPYNIDSRGIPFIQRLDLHSIGDHNFKRYFFQFTYTCCFNIDYNTHNIDFIWVQLVLGDEMCAEILHHYWSFDCSFIQFLCIVWTMIIQTNLKTKNFTRKISKLKSVFSVNRFLYSVDVGTSDDVRTNCIFILLFT